MKKIYIVLLTVLIAISVIFIYNSFTSPIKVALIGDFQEERYSFETNSIIAGRIAEKYINDGRGIKGRKTELIIRSDNLEEPEKTIQFLKDNHIDVVISTNNSSELIKARPYFDKNKIVCMSASSTTSNLSKSNDYIYRVMPNDEIEIKTMADYIKNQNYPKDIILVYDNENWEYKYSLEKVLREYGLNIIAEDTWNGESSKYEPANIETIKDKTVLIAATARDTGIVVQKLKPFTNKLFGFSWSGDNNLLVYGGKAVEGFMFTSPVDFNSTEGNYDALSKGLKGYNKNNGLIPNGVYQAYMIIKNAYEARFDRHITLKEALDSEETYKGLEGYAKLDEYGDSTSKEYIFTVENGKFIKVGGDVHEEVKN